MAANSLLSFGESTAAYPYLLSSSKSRFASADPLPCAAVIASSRIAMFAEWMPGQPRPTHLDGCSPGDFGFDPLGLATVPENFERFIIPGSISP